MSFPRAAARAALLSLSGLTGLSLSACAAGHTAVVETSASDAVLIATTGAASSLDFTTTGGAAIPAALMGNVYETLVVQAAQPSATGAEVSPGLARSWTVDDSGTKYTFELQRGVKFSNGDDFDATTAAWSINYARTQWSNSIARRMDVVADAQAVDSHTLQVRLKQPSQSWLWTMSTTVGAMMTPAAVQTLATAPVGTGPFTVERFSPGEFISLRRNPSYWSTPARSDVTIQYFPDALTSINALQSGGVDVVWAAQNPELLANLPEDISTLIGSTNGEVLVSMNNQAAPFDDPRVRLAVAYGVDRRAANTIIFDGLAADTGGAPVSPADPWATGKDYFPYDPQRARELMEQAGAVGTPLTITVPSLPYTQTLAELMYSQLRDIGFDVKLETVEFPAVWLGKVMGAKDYQMSMVAHVEPRDITTIFGNPQYYLGFDDARTRELFAAADSAPTKAQSNELMAQAVDRIMEQAGALTVVNMPNIVLTGAGVSGVDPNMTRDGINLRQVSK